MAHSSAHRVRPSTRRTAGRRSSRWAFMALLAVLALPAARAAEARFPDVLKAAVRAAANGRFDFDVTISSAYDTPARYADGFRVTTLEGAVLGERALGHDHQHEQPFTRDLYGVAAPPGVARVRIQARDQRHGYGGRAIEVALPGRAR